MGDLVQQYWNLGWKLGSKEPFMIFLFDEFVKFINPSHLNISMQILHTVSYTFYGADNENLFNNQELLKLVIIFLILATLVCDSGMILRENIGC